MTLRKRLAISHFLVIVVFAIVFISIVMMMTEDGVATFSLMR